MSHFKILCVDDENNVLQALKRLFRGESFTVYTALSGPEALSIIEQNQISLIISDYRMPQMTGVELLKKVKEISPKTIRVMLSGYADSDVTLDAINRGEVYRFITKPWDDNNLKQVVKECVSHYTQNPIAP